MDTKLTYLYCKLETERKKLYLLGTNLGLNHDHTLRQSIVVDTILNRINCLKSQTDDSTTTNTSLHKQQAHGSY
jgi:hypothetical protein